MNRYRVSLTLEIEVEAFDPNDALEATEEAFGTGSAGGALEVKEYKVLEYAELV